MHGRGLNMTHIRIWPTNVIPTLQKHITTKHSYIMNLPVNVQVFFHPSTERQMQQRCYFWRGMKTYFSSLLMMLISSQSKTCKWNVWTQLSKMFYGGGKSSLWTKCLQKRDSTQLVTCPDFLSMLRCIHWLVTKKKITGPWITPIPDAELICMQVRFSFISE